MQQIHQEKVEAVKDEFGNPWEVALDDLEMVRELSDGSNRDFTVTSRYLRSESQG